MSEDRWRGETVLQSTFGSKLLNLGRVAASDTPTGDCLLANQEPPQLLNLSLPPSFPHSVSLSFFPFLSSVRQVSTQALHSLCCFLRERRPLLSVAAAAPPPQDLRRLPYATLRTLRVNTLVHALLRITHMHLGTGERVM